jgi:hypothetical protein
MLLGPVTTTIEGRPITNPARFFNGSEYVLFSVRHSDCLAFTLTLHFCCSLTFSPPFPLSSNTGYERVDTEVVMLVQDTTGAVSLVLLHDAPCDTLTNFYCPITGAGYDANCGRACDADGSLITFRTTMFRPCGLNGSACAQRVAFPPWNAASPRDLTPYNAAPEPVFVSNTYTGGGASCCPPRGVVGPNLIDWSVPRPWFHLPRDVQLTVDAPCSSSGPCSAVYQPGIGSFNSVNLLNGGSTSRMITVRDSSLNL